MILGGGLSVLNHLISKNNNLDIYYYADSLNNPWGNKTKDELKKILYTISSWFKNMNVDYVICGCNTTFSLFKSELDDIFNLPVFNLISTTGHLYTSHSYSILSTENTAKTNIFSTILTKTNPSILTKKLHALVLANAMKKIKPTA